MILSFTDLLLKAGVTPSHVRMLRHQTRTPEGRTPYLMWRDNRDAFESYQSVQTLGNRSKLDAPVWAAFVAPPTGGTLFVGLYSAERSGSIDATWIDPLYGKPGIDLTDDGLDQYTLKSMVDLAFYSGRLWIDWGAGARSWIQRPDFQQKTITELTAAFREDAFPGYTHFIAKISEIRALPRGWLAALRAARGVYLLTSARTKEQYVGSAAGADGFLGRWFDYARDGHGGNLGLKSNEPSDYEVSVLEVVGSAASIQDIVDIEQLWKKKLQSREMGLNRN